MQLLGSLVFTLFVFLFTFLYAVFFVVAAALVPFERRFALVRTWARTLLTVLHWTCRLDYVVEGRENLPAGNHVALWKHASTWETIAMAAVLPRSVWVLKRELTWLPVVGWALRQLHSIAINRRAGQSAVTQVLEQGRARLAEGDWVVVFPEGTRMAPGETRRYGLSGTLLAAANDRLIVPVAHNAGAFWQRRGLLKSPGTVRVVIGPPIAAAGRDPRKVNVEVQQWIEATVERIWPRTHE